MNNNIYQTITQHIMTYLEKGVLPWRSPMGSPEIALPLPVNARTGRMYHGINVVVLLMRGYDLPYWATEKTWNKMGAQVQEGEWPAVLYCPGRYQVYNLSQVLGCDHLRVIPPGNDFAPAERLISSTNATILLGDRPLYEPETDLVFCPSKGQFSTAIGYYTTVLHELVHWTGHETRLHRPFCLDRRSDEYAFEELVAELGSCFVAASLRIPQALEEMPNHASYLSHWLSALKEDDRAIFRAATMAQKATEYLIRGVPCATKKVS